MGDWTIDVEGFGRIARAEVETKPLTVFVGKNNSGKSYLASLVWGVEHGGLTGMTAGTDVALAIGAWLDVARARSERWIRCPEDLEARLRSAWPSLVDRHRSELCRLLFDAGGIEPGRLQIGAPDLQRTWRARLDEHSDHDLFSFTSDPSGPARPTLQVEDGTHGDLDLLLAHMAAGLDRGPGPSAEYSTYDPIFLPASRTGFSLFLPTFVQSSLTATLTQGRSLRHGKRVERASPASRFTLPQIHLLNALALAFGGAPGPFADEAERLERECIEGTLVTRAEMGVARYAFRPQGSDAELGLQLTSALVTELMPLIVALRNAQSIPFLVLEEPEAHLHPHLVRAVIRCLCRLVRRGVRVLITTHSATVAQQVNNLVKLGALEPDRRASAQARYGYDPTEYLAPAEVGVHEFRFREDGRTVVDRIEAGPVGFPMPTFNRELQAFASETLELNDLVDPEPAESPATLSRPA